VLVNGNRIANLPPMEIAATKLRFKTGCFSAVVDIGLIARKEVAEICGHVPNSTDHAADAETSYMLYVHPELVDMAKAPQVPARAGKTGFVGHIPLEQPYDANMVLVHPTPEEYAVKTAPTGIGGDPRAATREKGERIFEAVVGNFARYVEDIKKLEVRLKPIEVPI
jgi:creatinine amidohydrolase